MSQPRLLLVDGHAYAYRSFHAIRSLNAPDGSPTNAIFGFVKALQKLDAILKPSHLLVVWDGGLDATRLTHLPDYKANRPATPDALDSQLPQLATWLDAHGWPQLQQEGTEADDWIGTYAVRAAAHDWSVIIASPDKDFLQLVNDRIGIFNPNDKSEKIWTPADVQAKTGVLPPLIADWLALIGDAVDNIPGIPGVGPKTAADLLNRFGSAEAALAAAPGIKAEKLRTELLAGAATLRRNQEMVRLRLDLAGGPDLDSLQPRPRDTDALRTLYRRWGFRGLLSELGGDAPVQGNLF